MKKYDVNTLLMILGVVLLLLDGCVSRASAPTKFYILSPVIGNEALKYNTEENNCPSIGIGPVHLPVYLDRPQIVTRVSPNELRLAELDHWAEPLKANVMGVLADNLSRLLCTEGLVVYPWKTSLHIDYRIEIEIVRMDGKPGEEAVLATQWAIVNPSKKSVLLEKTSQYTESAPGTGYSTLVAAYSRLIGAFSQDIAGAVRSLFPKGAHP